MRIITTILVGLIFLSSSIGQEPEFVSRTTLQRVCENGVCRWVEVKEMVPFQKKKEELKRAEEEKENRNKKIVFSIFEKEVDKPAKFDIFNNDFPEYAQSLVNMLKEKDIPLLVFVDCEPRKVPGFESAWSTSKSLKTDLKNKVLVTFYKDGKFLYKDIDFKSKDEQIKNLYESLNKRTIKITAIGWHIHKCENGHEWSHRDSSKGDIEAHKCPVCGSQDWMPKETNKRIIEEKERVVFQECPDNL